MLLVLSALAAMRSDAVTWTHGGVTFSGFLVWDDATAEARPGLVMVPNWMGVTPSAVEKAKNMAGNRYVVLVADVYGEKTRPKTADEAKAAAGAMKADLPTLRGRVAAAVATLQGAAPVDKARVGAYGYCFGGSAVLELARSGADVDAVVSLHGGLTTTMPATTVKASILVLNGAADQGVTDADIAALEGEMTAAKADWTLVDFGGAVHCFAEADAPGSANCAYDERAARRAHEMMGDFFAERLK